MIRSILPATILSSLVISAAWAAPISPNLQVNQFSSTNLAQVGYYDKNYYVTITKTIVAARGTIMAADIGVTVIMPVPTVGKP